MSSTLASSDLLYVTERGSGPPLLLVHGLMVTGEMFEPVIEHLSTRHRVIVPDLRGHGRSRGFPPPYTAAQLASDLKAFEDGSLPWTISATGSSVRRGARRPVSSCQGSLENPLRNTRAQHPAIVIPALRPSPAATPLRCAPCET